MSYLIIGLTVVIGGLVLRLALRLVVRSGRGVVFESFGLERLAVYAPVSQELEIEMTILGVALNDAIEERDAGRNENAWHMVELAAGEWKRVESAIQSLLDALEKNLPRALSVVPYRGMMTRRFKSKLMTDNSRIWELLDQLLLGSRVRFYFQIHILRRAMATLSTEFHLILNYGERTDDRPAEIWRRLDVYSHDFDVVCKESLMAFRAFLSCLPLVSLAEFSKDLQPVMRTGVRTASLSNSK